MADEIPEVSHLSVEFVSVPFADDIDPSTITAAQMAFTAGPDDDPTEWHDATIVEADALVRLLIGPGVLELAEGTYAVWCKLTDSPETTVEMTGLLSVY